MSYKIKLRENILATCIASLTTLSLFTPSFTLASDIQIYQNPKAQGKKIIMFMLDTSWSMQNTRDNTLESGLNRRQVMEDAVELILTGRLSSTSNSADKTKTITPLSDDTLVGFSMFSNNGKSNGSAGYGRGAIVVPARPLSAQVTDPLTQQTISQRSLLLRSVKYTSDANVAAQQLQPTYSATTPTVNLYAETVAYLKGTNTWGSINTEALGTKRNTAIGDDMGNANYQYSGWQDSQQSTKEINNTYYSSPLSQLASNDDKMCSAEGIFFFTDGTPTLITPEKALPLLQNALSKNGTDSGFNCDNSLLNPVFYDFSTQRQVTQTVPAVDALGNPIYDWVDQGSYVDQGSTQCGWVDQSGWVGIIWVPRWSWQCNWVPNKVWVSKWVQVQRMTTITVNQPAWNTNFAGAYPPFTSYSTSQYSQDRSSLGCIGNFAQKIYNGDPYSPDPLNKKIYTSIVGFGSDFNNNSANFLVSKEMRKWGYIGAHGNLDGYDNPQDVSQLTTTDGFTVASDTSGVVNAISNLVKSMDVKFGSSSFGSYVAPLDPLNVLSPYKDITNNLTPIFSPQFQPNVSSSNLTIGSTQQLWLGNLKKYQLLSGVIKDRNSINVIGNNGLVNKNTTDLWSANSTVADGDSAIKGGALSQLVPNGFNNANANINSVKTRPLYINAVAITTDPKKWQGASTLTQVTTNLVNQVDTMSQSDPNYNQNNRTITDTWRTRIYQPYLWSALGYQLNRGLLQAVQTPSSSGWSYDQVKNLPIMRQMGSVLHSDPFLLTTQATYDANDNLQSRKDYVVFGTLQGLLHIVDQSTGQEVAAFLPNEILQDATTIDGKTPTTQGGRRDGLLSVDNTVRSTDNPYYGIDAPWTSWVKYNPIIVGDSSRTIKATTANIYGGMRMGGYSYYGLDVKDIGSADQANATPKFLFQIDPINRKIISASSSIRDSNNTISDLAISTMGQSWSKPTIAKMRIAGQIKDVMIVGGGYDPDYENGSTNKTNDLGAGIYIFDATTGERLWDARYGATNSNSTNDYKVSNLKYSVVSQIKAVDRDGDGLVDHLYFGDLGGQVWRVDINNKNTSTSDISTFATVNRLANFNAQQQHFYEMPAFTIHQDNNGYFAAISLASGNRSNPLITSEPIPNRVYVLIDHDVTSPTLFNSRSKTLIDKGEADLVSFSDLNTGSKDRFTNQTKFGWYYPLTTDVQPTSTLLNNTKPQALGGYVVLANNGNLSDLYIPVYNPKQSSSQQPTQCSGGIVGTTSSLKLCLPYGYCSAVDKNASSASLGDGLQKLNPTIYRKSDGTSVIGLIGSGTTSTINNSTTNTNQQYGFSGKFKSVRWFEQ
ncbi:PilC/PilY family type IV pilus protein [Acinetobacter nectaris]|uniref:PilC/PilY family type IV pilus protein n=1 Tax=Acinetobacter nectaris TaxID=1219382 RepID=UPI001F285934|nr:PilC/PilY family type IV pilus protein [Acinetobacter nectaris]MCF9034246.1 hypothetical protein [Acinetobacter nectaris]